MNAASCISGSDNQPPRKLSGTKSPVTKKLKSEKLKSADKKGSFRNILRKGSTTTPPTLWNKDLLAKKTA
jgi:hypothetical protein